MNAIQPTSNRIEIVSPGIALEANYFAAALAHELVSKTPGELPDVVLIDGLRGCGGLDVALDLETQDGIRWPSLRGAQGRVDVEMLLASLPARDGVALLSHTQNAPGKCSPEVTRLISDSLSGTTTWCVQSRSEEVDPPVDGNLLVVVHGSLCALAAAQAYLQNCSRETSIGLVLLETPLTQRAMVEEALGAPVVAHAPTRWHMSGVAARNIVEGKWPHSGDRTFGSLVKDSAIFVRSQGRCLAWV